MKSLTASAAVRVIGLALLLLGPYWWVGVPAAVLLFLTADQASPIKLGLNKSTPFGRLLAILFADAAALCGIALVFDEHVRLLGLGIAGLCAIPVFGKYIRMYRAVAAHRAERRTQS